MPLPTSTEGHMMPSVLRPAGVRPALLAVLLAGHLAACGSPTERAACATSATCPAGQYCDVAGGAGVCWPDGVPPTVGGVAVTCSTTPCARDAVLTVEATATDAAEVGTVRASLDLDGGARSVAMSRVVGDLFRGQLSLAEWPFGGATATVRATVTVADGARNEAAATAAGVTVSRARGGILVGPGAAASAPAVLLDGTVVVGGADTKLYLLPPGHASMQAAAISFPTSVVHPPAIGASAIWVAAGSRVYAVSLDGATLLNGAGYDTTGTIVGPPALTSALVPETAFVASVTGRMYALRAAATADGLIDFTSALDPFSSGPVLRGDAAALGVTATASPAEATLRQFSFDGALGAGFARVVGAAVSAPLALDGVGAAWTSSTDVGKAVAQTSPIGVEGASIPLVATSGSGLAILAGGDVVFCDGTTVRRHSPDGTARWATPPTLAGPGLTPLVLTGGPVALLVPTRVGTVHALDAAGVELWSVTLAPGTELREGNLHHAPGAPTSTAWFTSAGGTLHGVVVDGRLDEAAPWPKAWHDPRNTGNVATPIAP